MTHLRLVSKQFSGKHGVACGDSVFVLSRVVLE